jgi:RNA polymerase sigma-70 factor (ECF subfamily)
MYSLKIVGIREEAEDIVQGCFTSVWERICNGDDIENIRAYMYGAVRNMSLTFLKRSSKIDELESGSEYGESVSADDIDTSERDARLWQAISDLPEKCRKVFLLSKKDGFSNAQIAEEMGISVKTVENQMTKAYSRLREALNPAGRKVFFLPFL